MNSFAFVLAFFCFTVLSGVLATGPNWIQEAFGGAALAGAGNGLVQFNNGLFVPLASGAAGAGTFAGPLAVIGAIYLAAGLAYGLGYAGTDGTFGLDGLGRASQRLRSRRLRQQRQRRDAGAGPAVSPNPEAMFQLISSIDTFGCGKQLVCELEAKPRATLAQDEALMVQLFSKGKINPASPKSEYDLAAELGMASKSQVICRERYATCPYTADEMMNAFRNAQQAQQQ